MKLIDLLVQELPKRGGWSDGAVECCRHYGTNSIDFYDETGNWDDDCYLKYGKDFAKDCVYEETLESHRLQSISRSEYEKALAASQKPAWNGEDLPPVGCECEYLDNNGKWYPVTIKYASEQLVVISGATKILGVEQGTEIAKDIIIDKPQFRPLQSEAERKHEAVLESICAVLEMVAQYYKREDEAKLIYEAIAAGKIPGVKLDD